MLTDNQISKINNYLEGKVFTYNGDIIYNVDKKADFDFKFKILGYKKMISVGEWYDYTKVSITLFNFRDDLSKFFFVDNEMVTSLKKDNLQSFWKEMFNKNWWYLESNITMELQTILSYFDNDVRVKIEEIYINDKKENLQIGRAHV